MAGAQAQRETPVQRRVLVVDDEPGMIETLSDVLEAHGYDVDTAASGEAAVAAVAAESCRGFVLMDIKMPGVDGVEAMQRIRALAPGVPVVLMTAYAGDALARAGSRDATAILQKPLDLERVLPMLRAIVDRHEGTCGQCHGRFWLIAPPRS